MSFLAADFKYPRWLNVAPTEIVSGRNSGRRNYHFWREPTRNNTGGASERGFLRAGCGGARCGIAFQEDYVYVGKT